ncbi:MAG: aldehyde dehydrogenase (NADP(+)) [Planctomycetes bacterium]|nr:aldehyde dehydrogenase (NADP(+)) [Planctomycetota bacterium]
MRCRAGAAATHASPGRPARRSARDDRARAAPAAGGCVVSARGEHWIAGHAEHAGGVAFRAYDPMTGAPFGPEFREATSDQVERACVAAAAEARQFARVEPAARGALLRAIAAGLDGLGDVLVQCAVAETALPAARIAAERARTALQLTQFAALVEEGSWVEASIDHGDAARAPQPKPDLRRMLVPIGPVAVFGASNFPLAYSVAGGDTASALAAGCPVVVKGHPAHPGTSELVARVIVKALRAARLPDGTFSLLHGRSHQVSSALLRQPAIAAVGFTGSFAGGRALFDLAAARPAPIPVFAEMGSMNPVFVLPNALARRGPEIAHRLAVSALLASGQFCTSPGMVVWTKGAGADAFAEALRAAIAAGIGAPVVHPSIHTGYERALAEVKALPVAETARGSAGAGALGVRPTLLEASAAVVASRPRLRSEIYGPAVLGVDCADAAEMTAVAQSLHGHLTATVHGDGDDLEQHGALLEILREKVGRLIANGVPTGVEVCTSMVHGGPWPASTDARFQAVGVTSIRRWARPVCWQDWPQDLLPAELRDDNPRGVRRVVDGVPR